MSLIISNIALHFLSKKEGSGEVSLRLGPENLTPEQGGTSTKITAFVDGLHAIYNGKASKAYGSFTAMPMAGNTESSNENSSNNSGLQAARFVDLMESYFNDKQSFYDFSIQAANSLKNEIEKYDIEETGYLVVCHYEYMGGRFLLVAVIPVSEHYSVDGELNISAAQHLDINKLQLAARIDLFDYQQNASGNRYISFIKGRAGRKVSDFFLDFLGCEEGLNSKEQTQTLVQAVEDYVSVNQLDATEKQQTRKELLSYCKEQKASSQDVSVQEIGKVIGHTTTDSAGQSQDFYQFCQQQSYPIEESFPHDQTVVNKITKYSGYGNGISLSFERSHFGQDVVYNQHNDSITIYKVPPNLKEQLQTLLANAGNVNDDPEILE
ncbi:nucleoid-associated protein YejK [Candidatus Colwellia aromaticivorans]|uniref:nucleoid-associated protein YejK n=1 Tax=Candidatus Colwellia aromaticivorans TaxID=2267621 RepID=UPI000DF394AA|nr:nucleoid-associated protein YejK [Candidatus Colwellia aromaticivorans]